MSSCMWGEQLPVRAQLQQICPLISSAAWVRRAEHEGFLAFCSVELAELIRMTATSASVQRKGQWLRLDARQFSRQLENTMKAHSIHAAGTEALPVGTSTQDVTVKGRRLEDDSTELACHCTSFIPTLTCTLKVHHPLCHCALLVSPSQYQGLLSASVVLSHTPGCSSCWTWGPYHLNSWCWVSPSHIPTAPPCFR